jgi:transcriptional regulator of arginine metabolism
MPIDREVQDRRRKAMVEMLATQQLRRQVEIGRLLRKQGFKVTQSSVSRDLKALGIVRREGIYRLPEKKGDEASIGKMEQFIQRVRTAGPYMLVIDTSAGTAKAVGEALKTAMWPEVRGVLAEDDTLFAATDNVYDTRLLLQRLKRTVQV